MPVPHSEAQSYVASHNGVLGKGWTEVDTLENLDLNEYELEVKEEYVTLDLGPEIGGKWLQTEGTYQLIGMDTPLPHLKIGNTILQGQVTPLIGTEILLGLIRNEENPLRPSHPPLYTTDKRITFRPITLQPIDQDLPTTTTATARVNSGRGTDGEEEEEVRPMFLKQPARYGPNAPEKLPGRKRDRDRAARRAERLEAGMDVDLDHEDEDDNEGGSGAEGMGMGMEIDTNDPTPATLEDFTAYSSILSTTPGAGPSSPSPSTITRTSPNTNTSTRFDPLTPIGRPRTRPTIEITSLPELAHLDIAALPANIRIMVLPHVIHELDPTPTSTSDSIHLPKKPLEFTKGQIKKLINGPSSKARRIQGRRFEHLALTDEGASLPSSYSNTNTPGPSTSTSNLDSPSTPISTRQGGHGHGMVGESSGSKVVTFNKRLIKHPEAPQFVTAGEPSPVVERRMAGTGTPGVAVREGDKIPEMRLDIRDEEDAEARDGQ